MNVYKGKSTRDLICLDFDFGSRSYEEEMSHLTKMLSKADNEKSRQHITDIIKKVNDNKFSYVKRSKDEIRDLFYENGVSVKYEKKDKNGVVIKTDIIEYQMLYRNSSKAKLGQVMFINKILYKKAYNWLTMGLGNKMPVNNAKIVEMSAYTPLTTSTIIDTIHIPIKDILILEDQDSKYQTLTKVVSAKDYEGFSKILDEEKTEKAKQKSIKSGKIDILGNPIYKKVYKKVPQIQKKCIVKDEVTEVKNTIWDGMGLIESSYLPEYINGMALLRNHFFKMCGFRSNVQLFFKNWCLQNGHDYETYEIKDMFGLPHKLKDIKIITTDNSIKWKKFINIMGGTPLSAYRYWCNKINKDGSMFGIVKTDHNSKLGDIQQMSYQMINTLHCTREDIKDIAQTSIDYVEVLKTDNQKFRDFLYKNKNEINHYQMMAALYDHNQEFANSKWFRTEKRKIINRYVTKLRSGKITASGDNLTICGNPYALLLYSIGEDFTKDPTLNHEDGAIQCYTTRFQDNEFLFAIRNPHNSPNNICFLHNRYSEEMKIYFPFSDNILAINCVQSDIQDRANGCDEDSDFFFVSNQPTLVKCAKSAYEQYPTIVNRLKESGIAYKNTPNEYAHMDNKFSLSKRGIGEASNLAQMALTYYWTEQNKELYDNFIILAVLAQVVIDGCKREYEVDALAEIERIKNMDCMKLLTDNGDLPLFMKYTKEIPTTKNGKELPYDEIESKRDKVKLRINSDLVCPMNWLQECLDKIQGSSRDNAIPTLDFFIKMNGKANDRQITKIQKLVNSYNSFIMANHNRLDEMSFWIEFDEKTDIFTKEIKKIKIGNEITINRLIEIALSVEKENCNAKCQKKYSDASKYSRRMLNTLYQQNPNKFLSNFITNAYF